MRSTHQGRNDCQGKKQKDHERYHSIHHKSTYLHPSPLFKLKCIVRFVVLKYKVFQLHYLKDDETLGPDEMVEIVEMVGIYETIISLKADLRASQVYLCTYSVYFYCARAKWNVCTSCAFCFCRNQRQNWRIK